MPEDLREKGLDALKNKVFREYAAAYSEIEENFVGQVQGFGLKFHRDGDTKSRAQACKKRLKEGGKAVFRNNDKSVYHGCISPACQACAKGKGSATIYISLMCHRNCYYCFNPNQEDYEAFSGKKKDWRAQLRALIKNEPETTHMALSGGEPLLHKEDTLEFFNTVREMLPGAHTRLYTSGDLLDQDMALALKEAGLKEIRFSVKMEDSPETRKMVLDKIKLAGQYIPCVMVEMPVIPGTMEEMKELLVELDRLGVFCINLLEFCFPFNNQEEYAKRGFELKYPPFQVLYNYWYSGGLAVDQSEAMCLELLEFAIENKLSMGVHYCSLENKHTGQVYIQNSQAERLSKTMMLSDRDFYIKAAKVFGEDREKAISILKSKGVLDYQSEEQYQYIQFHPKHVKYLKGSGIEIGLSYNILEMREGEPVIRELRIDLVDPDSFRYKEL